MFSFRNGLGLHSVQAVYTDSAMKLHPSIETDFLTQPVTSVYPVHLKFTPDQSGPTRGREAPFRGLVAMCTSQLLGSVSVAGVCMYICEE